MRIIQGLLPGIALLIGSTAFAQDYSKIEVPVNYSYAQWNPARFGNSRHLNGGGGGVTYNFNRFFGLQGNLEGYGTTTATFTNVPVVNPLGTTIVPSLTAQGNLFTFMGGPQVRIPTHTFKPFAEFLVGGAHSNIYANILTATHVTGGSSSNVAFAMAVGGGIDIRINKSISIRPFQMDFLMTHFGNDSLGIRGVNQNNFRYLAGVVFTVE